MNIMSIVEKAERDIAYGVYNTDAEIVAGLVYEGYTEAESIAAVKTAHALINGILSTPPVYDKSGTNDLPF